MKQRYTIKKTIQSLKQFRDERNWLQFHSPKDLSMAIVIEASELQEIFLWKHSDEIEDFSSRNIKEIKSEIADVLTYSLFLCDRLNIDPLEVVMNKLEVSRRKYPRVKSNNVSSNKYQKH